MIFAKDNIELEFLEVLSFSNQNISWPSSARSYGALSIRTDSEAVITYNGKRIPLSSGCVAYFPPNIDYTREALRDNVIVIHLNVKNYQSHEIEYFYPKNPERFYELFSKLYNKFSSPKGESRLFSTARVYRLLAELHESYCEETVNENPVVEQAKKIMQENFSNSSLSIESISAELNICSGYLRRLFSEYNDTSAKAYLQRLRINNASRLLLLNSSVREAALQSGFSDEKYFSVAFKKATGVSPSKFSEEFY